MKIRSGFVSNSSSSSFIVRFPKDPTDINTLREMMGDCAPNCGYSSMRPLSSDEVINSVHRTIMQQKVGGFDDYYENNRYDRDRYENAYDEHPTMKNAYDGRCWYDLTDEESDAIVKMWLWEEYKVKLSSDSFVYMFEYADDCGEFQCQMEHGNIFRNVDHDVKSNH